MTSSLRTTDHALFYTDDYCKSVMSHTTGGPLGDNDIDKEGGIKINYGNIKINVRFSRRFVFGKNAE